MRTSVPLTEAAHLSGSLDRLRATFPYKVDGLDAAGLNDTLGSSSLTLGGLTKHLALQEDHRLRVKLRGEELGSPWDVQRLGRRRRLGG